MGARRARAPAYVLAPVGGLATFAAATCSRSRYPVPPASGRSPLRAAPRPQRRQPARSGPPDASLAPPQPCGLGGAGLPGARVRSRANPPTHWPPPPRPLFPHAVVGAAPLATQPVPLHLLRLRRSPRTVPVPFCGFSHSQTRGHAVLSPIGCCSSNHWPEVPAHFLGEFNTSRQQEEAVASLGARSGMGGS